MGKQLNTLIPVLLFVLCKNMLINNANKKRGFCILCWGHNRIFIYCVYFVHKFDIRCI